MPIKITGSLALGLALGESAASLIGDLSPCKSHGFYRRDAGGVQGAHENRKPTPEPTSQQVRCRGQEGNESVPATFIAASSKPGTIFSGVLFSEVLCPSGCIPRSQDPFASVKGNRTQLILLLLV